MSLFRRGRVWWTYFYIDGVRYQLSTKTTYRRQAEAVERKIIKETTARHRGLVRTDPNMPFAELAARFVATTDPPAFTLERLKELLKFFAEIPVIHINKSLVEEYRRVRRRKKKWISNATLNRDVSVLRRILFWGVEEALLKSNPLSRIRMLRERRIQRQVISLREERAVLQAAPEHLRLIIIAALDTGMRRGEILTQRWEHVDLEREVLSVTRSKTPEGQAREIPLTKRLFSHLVPLEKPKGAVFNYEGRPIRWVYRGWCSALKRAGIRHIRFHDLRHGFNTRLMEAGVLQEVRMALMGHVNPQRVHSIYTHIELPVKRQAIRQLEEWIESKTRKTNKEE